MMMGESCIMGTYGANELWKCHNMTNKKFFVVFNEISIKIVAQVSQQRRRMSRGSSVKVGQQSADESRNSGDLFFAKDGFASTAKISVNVFHFINSVFPERSRNGLKLKSACHVALKPHSPRRSFQTFWFQKLSHHVTHFKCSIEINSRNVILLLMQTTAALFIMQLTTIAHLHLSKQQAW